MGVTLLTKQTGDGVFEEITEQMQEAARAVEPLVRQFAARIAEDSERLQGSDAPLVAPLTDQSQIQTVRRIRGEVRELEKQLADVHQKLLTAAQAISLHWVIPGDIDDELKRVSEAPKSAIDGG